MKNRLYGPWAIIICVLFLVSSCLKDDSVSYSTYEDTAITSFTLGTVKVNRYVGKKKYARDENGERIDSFYTYSYAGSNTPVYIDHYSREIYNVDSLPAGSHMKMLATVSSMNSATMTYREWTADDDASWAEQLKAVDDAEWTVYSSGDSIEFGTDYADSKVLCFRVWASEGGYTRDYKVKIVAHKEYADSFQYVTLPSQAVFADAQTLKGAATANGIYVLAGNGTESKLYCGTNHGTSWAVVKTFGGDATIASSADVLYILDGNTLHYGDGSAWNTADVAGFDLSALVGVCKDEVYAVDGSGAVMVAKTDDVAVWEQDEVYADADLLPAKDICSASVVQRSNSDVSRITVVGNKAVYEGADTLAVVWNKNVGSASAEKWIYNDATEAQTKQLALPAMTALSATGYYNGWLLAVGGTGLNASTPLNNQPYQRIYCSEDGGTSWHKLAGLRMPDLALDAEKPVLIVADAEGFFYLVSADGGKVYRCKLNNATWDSTDYNEYK